MRRSFNPEVRHARFSIGGKTIQNLLPVTNDMQVGRVRQTFLLNDALIRRKRLIKGRDLFGMLAGTGVIVRQADPYQRHHAHRLRASSRSSAFL